MPSMTLTEYLTENKMSQPEFATVAGIPQSRVSYACNGISVSKNIAWKIQKATGGTVSALHLLYPDHHEKDKAADGRDASL